MTQQIHPAVDHLLHSGQFVCRPHVEIFTEHELKNAKGEVVRKVDKETLEKIVNVNNEKVSKGNLTPLFIGHTYDDVYNEKGELVQKFPEEKQPKPIGYDLNFTLELNPNTNKYSIFADEMIQRTIIDPETGKPTDGLRYSATFPRRSSEVYHKEFWIDAVAALCRAPRLDMGLATYAKVEPDHALYSRSADGTEFSVCQMARGKHRYSFETGGGEMDDPTKPPTAEPAPASTPAAPPAGGDNLGLSPEHVQAAEKYAHHVSGMHPSRFKKLMGHLHQKYAAECGMPGDMNTEYAMAVPGAAAVAPQPASGQQPPPAAGKPQEEMMRMQHDQAAIEKDRYERRLAAAETELAEIRAKELTGHMRYELQQMIAEGFDIDAAKQLTFMTERRYGRQQVDDHIGILRGVAQKAPVGDIPPLSETISREFRIPQGGKKDYSKSEEVPDDEFAKMSRYQRQHPDMAWDEVKVRYNKPETNGAAAK